MRLENIAVLHVEQIQGIQDQPVRKECFAVKFLRQIFLLLLQYQLLFRQMLVVVIVYQVVAHLHVQYLVLRHQVGPAVL
jgi:hypothetical protein